MTIGARFEQRDHADRRRAPRKALRLGVETWSSGGPSDATIHNISATGMMLETGAPLHEGEEFLVDLPEAGECIAQVAWADAPMFGCRFDEDLSPAALSAVRLRAATPGAAPVPGHLPMEEFGARLRRLRVERGLSLGDIAARLSVSKPTVWAWEHGKARPVERRLAALADALGVTPGGLEPAAAAPPEELERSRQRIAQVYGVSPASVRIMIEL